MTEFYPSFASKMVGQFAPALVGQFNRRVQLTLGYTDDAVYQNFVSTYSSSDLNYLYQAHSSFDSDDSLQAASNCQLVGTGCLHTQLFTQVNAIYLQTYTGGHFQFTPQQQSDLEYIACLDPDANGAAVYQARALLGVVGDCNSNGLSRSAITTEEHLSNSILLNHSIYPNPNDGSFIIEYLLENNAVFTLYDLSGKLIFSSKIVFGTQQISLQNNISSGMYLYSITDEFGEVENGKISVK